MLRDSDRIFTNLYGAHDWRLAGARARGDWDGSAALMARGQDWIVDQVKESGPARARRRRLPHRAQMVLHAEGGDPRPPHYLVVNADESEPGTCKDRT